MATSHMANALRPGATRLPIGLFIGGLLILLIAAATLAPRVGNFGQGVNGGSIEESGYGAGYPMHFGLAGPSQLSHWAEHVGYGDGYPLLGGLAGPSRLVLQAEHDGYGMGYPLHGGLAGPSRLSLQAEHDGYGAGYPLHGGLAGPSQVDEAP